MPYQQQNLVTADYPDGRQSFDPQRPFPLSAAELIGAHPTIRAPRAPIESWQLVGGGISTSGITNTTWQLQFATRGKAYAGRVTYFNNTIATYVIDKTTFTPSTTYVQGGDPTGGATPVNVTWSAAANITVPAAPSVNEAAFATSDWMLLSPLDRTDIVGAPGLWHIRSWVNAASGQNYQSTTLSQTYDGNVAAGMIRFGATMAGDKIATPSGFVASNPGLILAMGLEFRSAVRALRLGVIGDSIAAGTEGATAQYLANYAEIACHISNAQTVASAAIIPAFWSSMNFGWPSQTLIQYAARLPTILTTYQLDALVIPVWSPNSSPGTQAATDDNIGRVLDMIARCVAAKVVPILATMGPRNSYTITNDNPRKAINNVFRAVAKANGYPLVDFDLLLSDQATPAQYISNSSSDGLHPNYAYKQLMAAQLANMLSSVILI